MSLSSDADEMFPVDHPIPERSDAGGAPYAASDSVTSQSHCGDPQASDASSDAAAGSQVTREDDVRARLLAAAGPVFARHGFDRATVREICGDAGVNIASVGYYFGDKFRLYREVFRAIRSQCQDSHPVPDSLELTPREELFVLVRHLLSRMLARDDSGWESQLMMREMNHPTEVFAEMVDESFRPLFERLVRTIGLLSPPATPVHVLEQLALSVVGQSLYYRVGGGVVRHLIPPDRLAVNFTVESLARHIAGVTIAAAEGGLARNHAEKLGATRMDSAASDHPPS